LILVVEKDPGCIPLQPLGAKPSSDRTRRKRMSPPRLGDNAHGRNAAHSTCPRPEASHARVFAVWVSTA
jgi:hypothetical protein